METTITIEGIESIITNEHYYDNKRTTVCILSLKNGFEVVGSSGVVDASNFDAEIGKKIAREKAIEKIWLVEGYRLQNDMYKNTQQDL